MIKLKQLKQTKKGVIFNICVSPGKKGFKIKEYSKWNNSLNINTKQKPQRGKANKEIEKKLGEILGKKTRIVKGARAKNKKVLVHAKKREVLSKLKQFLS